MKKYITYTVILFWGIAIYFTQNVILINLLMTLYTFSIVASFSILIAYLFNKDIIKFLKSDIYEDGIRFWYSTVISFAHFMLFVVLNDIQACIIIMISMLCNIALYFLSTRKIKEF